MHGLPNDFGLEPLLGVPLLSPSVLILELLQPGHRGRIHAAMPTALLVKRGRALNDGTIPPIAAAHVDALLDGGIAGACAKILCPEKGLEAKLLAARRRTGNN